MEFLRRNINKQLRNGDIISSSISSSYIGGSNSSGGGVSGNYLPATMNDENIYIVPHYVTFQETITTTDTDGNETETIKNLLEITSNGLIVNGNIIASGDVSAFGSGSTSGSASGSTIDIEDNLTSNRTDAALSANQGRIIKNLIDNIDVDVDLSNYYTKAQVNSLINNVDVDLSEYLKTTTFNTHTADTTVHITSAERTNWNKVYEDWNDVFTIDSNGNLKVKVNLIGEKDVSAYGSGSTSDSGIGVIDIVDNLTSTATTAALSANQGRILKGLIDNIDLDGVEVDLSNYYTKEEVNNSFAETNHSHPYATTTNFNSHSGNTTMHITAAERTAWNKVSSHTHNYASTVKIGSTSYNASANTISLPSYPTLSSLSGVSTSSFNTHTSNTTSHITSAERTKWNNAVTSSHTHSNKSVLDGITSTKVANWDKVYEDWNDVFTINSNGDLQVKVNVIGEKDVSAYGSDSSSSSGAITIVDNLTSTATTAALSANQGRVLKNLIDNIDVGNIDVDLSNYYTKSEVNNSFASSNHNHSVATTSASGFMSASDKSKLDGITASADSVSFTRSLTAGTKVGTITINGTGTDIYCEKNTNTTYSNATSGTSGLMSAADKTKLDGITASADSVSFSRSLTAGTKVGTITINGTGTDIYCEKNTNTTYSVVGANGTTGLVKNGSSVTNANGYTACPIVGGIPYYKDTNTTYSLSSFGITATAAELNYCDGVTSNIQTQLNGKSATHSHPYASSSHTHALSELTSTAHTHTTIVGNYTANGGQQAPNYFGKNRVGALMMNTTVNSNSQYKDWLFMDCYNGNDVGGGVAFGVNRQSLGAYIMRSASGRTSWSESAELIGTHNYTTYCAKASHSHNYAGSSSAGGAATSANKINTNGGNATTPVYFSGGVPVACTSYANASVKYATSAGSATNATTASKLSTVSKTAWGQTYWTSGGIPQSISGNMTGVGSITASGAITCASLTANGEVTAQSDRRLKSNIQPLKVRGELNPVTFEKDGKQSIGFIAQEVRELYPELVKEDNTEEHYLSINYAQLTAVLYAEIQELKKKITELENKI